MVGARGRKPGQKRNPKGGRPYQREYGEPDGKAQDNFTDPQSRIMKTSADGFQQCYNAQLAVAGENQLIVAVAVASNASDQGRLTPLVEAVESTHGRRPETVLADAGYCHEAELDKLENARGGRGLGPGGPARGRGGRGEASGEGAHGPKAGDRGGPGAVRRAQVAVGGADRMDQGGAGFPAIQRAGPEQGPGRMGLGVPGVERQADARA